MQCPECGYAQEDGAAVCNLCGALLAKRADAGGEARPEPEAPLPEAAALAPYAFGRAEWKALGAGLGIAALVLALGLPRHIFAMLKILFHEFGHALFGWLFGYPSIPAFDFRYGGGLTTHQDQKLAIVLLAFAGLGWLIYALRQNRAGLAAAAGLAALYAALVFTDAHRTIVLFMGHGTELAFAVLFLYRAATCSGVIRAIERPLYAACGFFIVFHDLYFAWGLIADPYAQELYKRQKGLMHFGDFSRIGLRHLGVSMETVAGFFLVCCLLAIPLAFALVRYRAYWQAALARLLDTDP